MLRRPLNNGTERAAAESYYSFPIRYMDEWRYINKWTCDVKVGPCANDSLPEVSPAL
jgi:hypothetical protein